MICYYNMAVGSPLGEHCRAAVKFLAPVTENGGEVVTGNVEYPIDDYVVTCDKNPNETPDIPLDPIYNDGGKRITGQLGTQIMGIEGPAPTVYLNRGALHTGIHVAESYIVVPYANILSHGAGQCSVWATIPPVR